MKRSLVAIGLVFLVVGLTAAGAGDLVRPNGSVAVLMYHHLATPEERPEEPGVITPERFESHLSMLREDGYRLISASEFAAFRTGRLRLSGRSILITLDDGYESNYTLGFPILQEYRAPAIIFPVMKFFDTDGKGAWSPHLVGAQAIEMIASGWIEFGGHSYDGHGMVRVDAGVRHGPFLSSRAWLPAEGRSETELEYRSRVRADLRLAFESLRAIGVMEQELHWALPNGASSPGYLEELAALGFRFVYSTDDRHVNTPGDGLIHRLDAGSPHVTPEWLQNRLETLFAATETQ